ncbi:MAG: ribonuclease H-like domain-containing protein [Acidobacteriota bacterium]
MLKNDLKDLTVFFDLEWVPDTAGATRLYDLPAGTGEREAMQVLWENTAGYDAEECPRPFVKYIFSRIVSIAFLSRRIVYVDGERQAEFKLSSLPKLPAVMEDADESYLIQRFLYFIGEREPNLVGFNSAESDLQVLIQRGLVNEVTAPKFCTRPNKPWDGRDYFYRYGEEHLDLLRHFSNGKMTPRLNEIARLCGFPGKIDVDGQQVVELWLAGDIKSIVEYNQIDTLNTYLVWLRFVHFCGKMEDQEYQDELYQFRDFLETEASLPDRQHIEKFLAKWEL